MDSYDYELADMAERQTIEEEARAMMESYASKIRGWIKSGEVPAVKFSTMVIEGIPEESILGYARDKNPQLVVMGTRGADKKEAELIASRLRCLTPVVFRPSQCLRMWMWPS